MARGVSAGPLHSSGIRSAIYKTADRLLIAFIWCSLPGLLLAQNRDCDPVVLTGSALSCLIGESPDSIVAFRYTPGLWVQIPMQIDERVWLDVSAPYGPNNCLGGSTIPNSWNVLFYADDKTYVGADTNLLVDADDELVFMAKDLGIQFIAGTCPPNVIDESLCESSVYDPVNGNLLGYVYLFKQDGALLQSAGQDYVDYQFTYDSTYLGLYDICNGGNPESSVISTSAYQVGFSERWIEDDLKITAASATGIDILDRHQAFVYLNNCFRTEETFSAASGPIVNIIDGPVRAIRSVMGSNSGTYNHSLQEFTECRADYRLFFRVHPIGGFYDVFDFNSAAIGMSYFNNQNPSAVQIDGIPETLNTIFPMMWDCYDGPQGALIRSFSYNTDMTTGTITQLGVGVVQGGLEAFYDDAGTMAAHTCTGDGQSIGSSGLHLLTGQCTDRRHPDPGCDPINVRYFNTHNVHYYLSPGQNIQSAQAYDEYARNPLSVSSVQIPTACSVLEATPNPPFVKTEISRVKVFPNPLDDSRQLQLQIPSNWSEQWFSLIDIQGRIIMRVMLPPGEQTLLLSELESGMYYVRAEQNLWGSKVLIP